jgi:uncharacterized protein YbbC (DUF1343 family)
MARVQLGIRVLLNEYRDRLKGARIGLVTNPTGADETLRPTLDALLAAGLTVTALFGPEHGIRGDAPAGAHVESSTDPVTGLPVYSLYGPTRKPTPEMLSGVDVLLFEIQDAGARFYTYTWTMAKCMEAAAAQGKGVVILDRPNPITGRYVEGGLVAPGYTSLVGLYPVPIRHGMTHGEIARWLNGTQGLGCDLTVIPMKGWQRAMWWEETGLPFVPPSPNANSTTMLQLYTGTCFIEGTNLSEGRGTALPFQQFGAPWLDERAVIAELQRRNLPGVLFRPTYFTPTTSKHAGTFCRGVQIHVIDREALQPVALGVHLLDVLKRIHPAELEWVTWGAKHPSIDLLSGSARLRETIDTGTGVDGLLAEWAAEAAAFTASAAAYYLYE